MRAILSSILLFLLFACGHVEKKKAVENSKQEQATNTIPPKLQMIVDEKVEVLYYVFLLTDYPLISKYATSYKADALNYFEPYKQHEAVALANDLFEQGFGADFPINWIFQRTEFPAFEKRGEVDFPFELIKSDSLDLFANALRSFYLDAKCDSFLQMQQPFLEAMLKSTQAKLKRTDIIEVLEDYFGVQKKAEYIVAISPLLHQGGFSAERTDVPVLEAFVGPNKIADSIPLFDHVFLEQDMIIHEFGHNYVNPVVDQYLDQTLALKDSLYPLVEENIKSEGYFAWDSYLYELVDRSTTIRIIENIYGKEAAQELLEYEISVGFEHCQIVIELLKEYESKRKIYPTLADFFPLIIEGLEKADLRSLQEK